MNRPKGHLDPEIGSLPCKGCEAIYLKKNHFLGCQLSHLCTTLQDRDRRDPCKVYSEDEDRQGQASL